MKKILFAAVAVLALAACSKNEVYENTSDARLIGFGTYTGIASKADGSLINGTALNANFSVYGYNTGATAFSVAAVAAPTLMSDQLVTYAGGKYTYTPLRYWPTDEANNKLSFFAVYPTSVKMANLATAKAGNVAFTTADAPASQIDFMVSDIAADMAYSNTNTTTNGLVSLNFHHMLTKVNVKAKGVNDENGTIAVTVKSVTFSGINNAGTLTPSFEAAANENNGSTTFAWSGVTGDKTYAYPVDGAVLPTDAFAYVCGNANVNSAALLMVPQTISSTAKITIVYDYTYTPKAELGQPAYTITGNTISGNLSIDAMKSWFMGKNVTYTFAIGIATGSHPIEFTAVAADWADEVEVAVL